MKILGGIIAVLAVAAIVTACSSSSPPAPPVTVTQTATTLATMSVTATDTATVTGHPTVVKVVKTKVKTHTVTYTPPPPKQYGAGTYLVGSDIKPGVYRTSGGEGCYWARLASLNTQDIIDNDLSNGPMILQVQPSDKAIEISGNCSFGKA